MDEKLLLITFLGLALVPPCTNLILALNYLVALRQTRVIG